MQKYINCLLSFPLVDLSFSCFKKIETINTCSTRMSNAVNGKNLCTELMNFLLRFTLDLVPIQFNSQPILKHQCKMVFSKIQNTFFYKWKTFSTLLSTWHASIGCLCPIRICVTLGLFWTIVLIQRLRLNESCFNPCIGCRCVKNFHNFIHLVEALSLWRFLLSNLLNSVNQICVRSFL